MTYRYLSTLFVFFISAFLQAQERANTTFLDSIKATYVVDKTASCIDEKCMNELTNIEISNDLIADIKNTDLSKKVDYPLSTELLKERLRLLDEKSPFHIEYNVELENLIKNFLKNRKHSFERLMGISEFYFPMFEEALAKYNIPLEIKYLAIVESALNPKAVSRVGATGLWQFMYQTGKQYNLKVNSYVDERSDALKASDAAARYMEGMYKVFSDWELVLASYNSGAGNVTKAIRRSGGYHNFWNIKKYLPRETQSYVPAFLATMYIFEYHKEHGIVPQKAVVKHFSTDTIAVKRKISFQQLSDLLDMPINQIEFLNPSYKMKVIPFVTNELNFVCLPKDKIAIFASNEDKMYAYVDYVEVNREKPFVKTYIPKADSVLVTNRSNEQEFETKISYKKATKVKLYKIKKGDSLGEIAQKNNVSISNLQKWNKIKKNLIIPGKNLKILVETRVAVAQKVKKPSINDTLNKENSDIKTTSVALNDSVSKEQNKLYYIIKKGDYLAQVAQNYKVSVTDLKKWNNLTSNNLHTGDSLLVGENKPILEKTLPKKGSKSILEKQKMYVVQKGDSLYSISLKHKISIAEIKNLNGNKVNNLMPGMKIKI